jgi:hypothetical protein
VIIVTAMGCVLGAKPGTREVTWAHRMDHCTPDSTSPADNMWKSASVPTIRLVARPLVASWFPVIGILRLPLSFFFRSLLAIIRQIGQILSNGYSSFFRTRQISQLRLSIAQLRSIIDVFRPSMSPISLVPPKQAGSPNITSTTFQHQSSSLTVTMMRRFERRESQSTTTTFWNPTNRSGR